MVYMQFNSTTQKAELGKLKNKIIFEVRADPDKVFWQFVTDEGNVNYYCHGDCCSQSWVNHISGIDVLLGQQVLEVEEFDMYGMYDIEPEATKQDSDKVLFHRLITSKGICSLEFRNSSNGYYGGEFEEISDEKINDKQYGAEELHKISEDF